jgi:hypothetical protein
MKKVLFGSLAACQLGFATPEMSGCASFEDGTIRCNVSGLSSDFTLKCGFRSGCELGFPGYYIENPFTVNATLTTTPTSYPATFVTVGGGEPSDYGSDKLEAQMMLTKTLFTRFEGEVRLVNSWLLTHWTNF